MYDLRGEYELKQIRSTWTHIIHMEEMKRKAQHDQDMDKLNWLGVSSGVVALAGIDPQPRHQALIADLTEKIAAQRRIVEPVCLRLAEHFGLYFHNEYQKQHAPGMNHRTEMIMVDWPLPDGLGYYRHQFPPEPQFLGGGKISPIGPAPDEVTVKFERFGVGMLHAHTGEKETIRGELAYDPERNIVFVLAERPPRQVW